MRRIYRRMFLIAPWLGPWPLANFPKPPDNVSVHLVSAGPSNNPPAQWVANTLGDLTKREFRAYRNPQTGNSQKPYVFPFALYPDDLNFQSDWLMLNDALAFDVRVYDPGAPLYNYMPSTTAPTPLGIVQPGDPGWLLMASQSSPPAPASFGAYCDLGWGWNPFASTMIYHPTPLPTGVPAPLFNLPHQVGWRAQFDASNAACNGYPCVYDTWSFHYENNGLDEEGLFVQYANAVQSTANSTNALPQFTAWQTPTIDQGTNGLDDDGFNGVDDAGERETAPPYDTPLRGIQVKLRVYERDARQVRETSVTHSFVQ